MNGEEATDMRERETPVNPEDPAPEKKRRSPVEVANLNLERAKVRAEVVSKKAEVKTLPAMLKAQIDKAIQAGNTDDLEEWFKDSAELVIAYVELRKKEDELRKD